MLEVLVESAVKRVVEGLYDDAAMVIIIKDGRAFVVKDRKALIGELSIGDLIGRLMREEVGRPGVFSGSF